MGVRSVSTSAFPMLRPITFHVDAVSHLVLQARQQPNSQAEVVEYLLSTETAEMQYETARCRPHLDEAFFTYLDRQIGMQTRSPSMLVVLICMKVPYMLKPHKAALCLCLTDAEHPQGTFAVRL